MPAPLNIYGFRVDAPNGDSAALDDLIRLWSRAWRRQGWNPVILTADHIPVSAGHLTAELNNLPTVNNPIYEMACYQRWAAMHYAGGGWMADFDLFNYGFSPNFPDFNNITRSCRPGQIVSCDLHVPCLVYGDANGYLGMAERFAAAAQSGNFPEVEIHGRRHTSDMIFLQGMGSHEYLQADIVREFGEDGWKQHRLVHYCSSRMKAFKPKGRWIPILEQNRKQP